MTLAQVDLIANICFWLMGFFMGCLVSRIMKDICSK